MPKEQRRPQTSDDQRRHFATVSWGTLIDTMKTLSNHAVAQLQAASAQTIAQRQGIAVSRLYDTLARAARQRERDTTRRAQGSDAEAN